jgi:hypothetical protein
MSSTIKRFAGEATGAFNKFNSFSNDNPLDAADIKDQSPRQEEPAQAPVQQRVQRRLRLESYQPSQSTNTGNGHAPISSAFLRGVGQANRYIMGDLSVQKEVDARNDKAVADWEAETGRKYSDVKSNEIDYETHTSWQSAYAKNEDVHPDVGRKNLVNTFDSQQKPIRMGNRLKAG